MLFATRRVFARSLILTGVAGALALFAAQTPAQAQQTSKKEAIRKMQSLNGWRDYLKVHRGVEKPGGLLGGPIEVKISQTTGGVHVGLPDRRELDPTVFGPPKMPRHYAGTPIITGVPPLLRGSASEGERTKVLTPFGDKHVVLPNGRLSIQAVDVTATDAAVTRDKVRFQASWEDKQGNTYTVKCCAKLAAHGLEFPTFGGVVTNVILHGHSNVGTPLMPSEFTYFAFWGFGAVGKNGEVLDKPRLIHGMLTEYVREEGYALGFDEDVVPTRVHFHLMIPPMRPDPAAGVFEKSPVRTGFTLPNGKPLPFWHVMFQNLDIESSRG